MLQRPIGVLYRSTTLILMIWIGLIDVAFAIGLSAIYSQIRTISTARS